MAQAPEADLERRADPPPINTNSVPARLMDRATRRSPRDLVMVGSDLVLKEDETARDVVVVGGSAQIDGHVTRDLVVVMGTAKLGPRAEIKRDLVVVGGTLEADPAAIVGHKRVVIGGGGTAAKGFPWVRWPSQWFNSGLLYARPLPHQYAWSWAIATIALLLYLTLAVLFPRQVQASVAALEEQPGNSLLTGLLAWLLLPAALLLTWLTWLTWLWIALLLLVTVRVLVLLRHVLLLGGFSARPKPTYCGQRRSDWNAAIVG